VEFGMTECGQDYPQAQMALLEFSLLAGIPEAHIFSKCNKAEKKR
jgi:hypothetical protein